MEINVLLKQAGYFQGVSEASLNAVAEICLTRAYQKREILFTEGQRGMALFGCLTGAVQLYKTTPDGKEVVIKMIKPGEMFGEVVLFEAGRYPVTAVALTKTSVFMLPKHQFHCLLQREDFRNDFIAMLMRKQRYLAEQIKYLSSYDVDDRFLFFLQERYGRHHRIIPSVSKKDLAAAIGATPETLSRMLLRLKHEGLVTWEGKAMIINEKFWQREDGKMENELNRP